MNPAGRDDTLPFFVEHKLSSDRGSSVHSDTVNFYAIIFYENDLWYFTDAIHLVILNIA